MFQISKMSKFKAFKNLRRSDFKNDKILSVYKIKALNIIKNVKIQTSKIRCASIRNFFLHFSNSGHPDMFSVFLNI